MISLLVEGKSDTLLSQACLAQTLLTHPAWRATSTSSHLDDSSISTSIRRVAFIGIPILSYPACTGPITPGVRHLSSRKPLLFLHARSYPVNLSTPNLSPFVWLAFPRGREVLSGVTSGVGLLRPVRA